MGAPKIYAKTLVYIYPRESAGFKLNLLPYLISNGAPLIK